MDDSSPFESSPAGRSRMNSSLQLSVKRDTAPFDTVQVSPKAPASPVTAVGGDEILLQKSRHIFILNTSGRPIFTRYGDESDFSDIFGVFQVLMSMGAQVSRGSSGQILPDALRRVTAGSTMSIHFHKVRELIYVMVTRRADSARSCARQLRLLHLQVLLIVPNVNDVLEQSPSYDVRRMFSHGDVALTKSLIRKLSNDPAYALGALRALPLPPKRRDGVTAAMREAKGGEGHLYSLLLHKLRIVAVVGPKGWPLYPEDALLLLNFAEGMTKTQSGEMWAPVCLPMYNDTGYLWCHCKVIGGGTVLLQLAASQEEFRVHSEAALRIVERLKEAELLGEVQGTVRTTFALPPDEMQQSVMWCVAVTCTRSQLMESERAPILHASRALRKRVLRQWVTLRDRVTNTATSDFSPITIQSTESEVLLVQNVSNQIHLFLCAEPFTDTVGLTAYAAKVADFVQQSLPTFAIMRASTWA